MRREVDPDGLFVGAWHRRTVLGGGGGGGAGVAAEEEDRGDEGEENGESEPLMGCEEQCVRMTGLRDGGVEWVGGPAIERGPGSAGSSEESFDVFAIAEAEESMLVEQHEDGGVEFGRR